MLLHHLSKRARYRLWRAWRWFVTAREPDPTLTADEEAADRLAW